MKKLSILFLGLILFSCKSPAQDKSEQKQADYKITKTDAEWKAQLSSEEYNILREAGTERPFSSELLEIKEEGVYVCAACETPLYRSKNKFESGTGWPSFDRVIEGNVAFSTDSKLGYSRNEEHCAVCGGHLGHVFDDGPQETTGKRHCINGDALDFIPKGKTEPQK